MLVAPLLHLPRSRHHPHLLLAASPAAAEVTWGLTGVEYAKRFDSSGSTPCWCTCPLQYTDDTGSYNAVNQNELEGSLSPG